MITEAAKIIKGSVIALNGSRFSAKTINSFSIGFQLELWRGKGKKKKTQPSVYLWRKRIWIQAKSESCCKGKDSHYLPVKQNSEGDSLTAVGDEIYFEPGIETNKKWDERMGVPIRCFFVTEFL